MKIAVYGASGLTGGLAVAELYRRGIAAVLVGRDEQRLHAAAKLATAATTATATAGAGAAADATEGEESDIRVAGLDDPESLTAALHGVDAVINTAGPFTRWGEPVVRAAIAAGCHYVDTNGEPRYHARIFETFAAPAAAAGVSVVPGMADDGGPGDLIASLTAARLGAVTGLIVADLREPGVVSRGTARSMVAALAEDPAGYGEAGGPGSGAAGPGPQSGIPQSGIPAMLTPPGGAGPVAVTAFPLPSGVTVPWHVDIAAVSTVIRADIAALFGTLTADYAEAVPELPDEAARAAGRWLMLAEAVDAGGHRARGWVTGHDAYGSTAVIAVEAARRLAAGGGPAGTLAPAQAFDPAAFLDFLAPHGVTWHVTGLED